MAASSSGRASGERLGTADELYERLASVAPTTDTIGSPRGSTGGAVARASRSPQTWRMPVPKYARDVPPDRLLRVFCKGGCLVTRYMELRELDTPHPAQVEGKPYYGYAAICLMCGKRMVDHYNWPKPI